MKILVINAGSSSLKYQLIDMTDESVVAKGLCERITMDSSVLTQKVAGKDKLVIESPMPTHKEAMELVLKALLDEKNGAIKSVKEISAVGHRVLHSGEDFKCSVVVDDDVIAKCKKNIDLGPLHMPGNISCVEACREVMDVPMVLVFDTTFHATMPPKAFMYGIPYEIYDEYKVRKYGFHGTSHKYIAGEAREWLGGDKKVIICHLGNGSSLSAVKDGKCMDTTMGFTPLEGVMMGTRSGDIDPAAVELAKHNAELAGVEDCIRFEVADAGKFHRDSEYGQLVTNPPYGERLLEKKEAEELYRVFGAALRDLPPKWRVLVLSSHTEFERCFGRTANKKRKLYNGMIKCDVFMYGR